MTAAALKLVAGTDTESPQPEPEDRLRALFRRQARLDKQSADVAAEIAAERERYRLKHGLMMQPRIALLREQLLPHAQRAAR